MTLPKKTTFLTPMRVTALLALLLCISPLAFAKTATQSPDVIALTKERQKADRYADDLILAWKSFEIGDSQKATELFQEVLVAEDSNESERVQALFGLGTNKQFGVPKPDYKAAREYYQRIVDEYPDNTVAAWAMLKLGILVGTDTPEEREETRRRYQAMLKRYPNSLAIHEATLRLAGSYFYEMDPEMAAKGPQILEEHLAKYPDTPLKAVMLFRLFYWYSEVDRDYDKSLATGLELAEHKLSDPDRWPQQYWGVAQMIRIKKNNPKESIQWYQKIIDEFPASRLVYPCRLIIKEIEAQMEEPSHE